jgi:hypothetical protein
MASIAHVALPPWKARIKQSLVQNSSLVYAKYVQLATVRPDGTPACRTVVFRWVGNVHPAAGGYPMTMRTSPNTKALVGDFWMMGMT